MLFRKTSKQIVMQGVVLLVTCLFLCLTFNCTFPLHPGVNYLDSNIEASPNSSNILNTPQDNVLGRSKKMVVTIENALRKLKDSSQDFGRNLYEHLNGNFGSEHQLSEDDLRQYEQLVLIKKHPYLDYKDFKFSPLVKNYRHNVRFADDAGFWEPDKPIQVEVINRGLSGFGIPNFNRKLIPDEGKLKSIKQPITVENENQNKVENNVLKLKDLRNYVERYM